MEFIPRVQDPKHTQLKIPLMVREGQEYTPGNFCAYPERCGYDLNALIRGELGEKSWEDVASFVQAWAYFGMITEILKLGHIHITNPFRNDPASTSEMLPKLVLLWYNNEIDRDEDYKRQKAQQADTIFSLVRGFLERVFWHEVHGENASSSEKVLDDETADTKASIGKIASSEHSHFVRKIITDKYYDRNSNFFSAESDWKGDYGRMSSPGHLVFIAIVVTGEYLANASKVIYGSSTSKKWPCPPLVQVLMAISGWCPFETKKLNTRCSTTRLYYLSSIDRGSDVGRHQQCCTRYCIANQVNKEVYRTKHASDDCTCEMISFEHTDMVKAATWIKAGYTGLIVRNTAKDDQIVWNLIPSHGDDGCPVRYVAISHVWGDGTGNPEKNALPSCQLDKFQNGANNLYDQSLQPVPFWIDTVCVPLSEPLRQLSIHQMDKVYKEADSVLTFDSTLEGVEIGDSSLELLTRIEVSSWMQRMWTLQEAFFAKNLYFQFKDGYRSVESLQVQYRSERFLKLAEMWAQADETETPLLRALARHLRHVHAKTLHNLMEPEEARGARLDEVFYSSSMTLGHLRLYRISTAGQEEVPFEYKSAWLNNTIPLRQTSMLGDEALCYGILLDMDISALYDLPLEEKITRVLLFMEKLPGGVIFGIRPRFESPGRRWMPSTLVGQLPVAGGPAASVAPEGLHVTFPGLIIKVIFKDCKIRGRWFVLSNGNILQRYVVDFEAECNFKIDGMVGLILEDLVSTTGRILCGALVLLKNWNGIPVERLEVDYIAPVFLKVSTTPELLPMQLNYPFSSLEADQKWLVS